MNAQLFDRFISTHEANLARYHDAAQDIEASAPLIAAAAVVLAYPHARWLVLTDSDQGDGMWPTAVVMDDCTEQEIDLADPPIDDWAGAAATDIHSRSDLVNLGDGDYALELWPIVDKWVSMFTLADELRRG